MVQKYRHTLKKQKEISNRLGKDYLKLLLDSLSTYFKERKEPIPEYIQSEDGKERTRIYILILSVFKNSEIEFQFILLSKTFNVYNLYYFSSIG